MDENGERIISRIIYSRKVNVSINILDKYIHKDKKKRRKIGLTLGRKPLLDPTSMEFVASSLNRRDKANEGCNPMEAFEMIRELQPGLSQKQARNHFD